jgi:hypothetical protein
VAATTLFCQQSAPTDALAIDKAGHDVRFGKYQDWSTYARKPKLAGVFHVKQGKYLRWTCYHAQPFIPNLFPGE